MNASIAPDATDAHPPPPAIADLSGALQAMYQATLRPDPWLGILAAIAPLFEASRALLIHVDHNLPSASVTDGIGIAPEHLRAIRERDLDQDLIWRAVLPLPAGLARRTTELLSEEVRARNPLYERIGVPAGLRYGLHANLENNAAHFTSISFMHHDRDFPDSAKATLQLLVPHLQTALQLSREIALAAAGRREALLRFDRVHQPMVVLDRSGYAIYTSQAALDLLRHAEGMALRFGRFIFRDIALQTEFERLLRLAVAGPQDEQPHPPYRLRVPRKDQPSPYGLSVVALSRSTDRALLPEGAGCMVLIHDMAGLTPLPVDRLSWLYDLTPGEARICEALYRTGSIEAAALELHLTRHTVRSHLKTIFVKFGVGTQGQLMQRLANSARLAEPGIDLLRQ